MTNTKPLLTAATITSLATAVIALLVAFGIPLTPEQREAILGVVAVLAPMLVWLASQNKVTANMRVVEELDTATGTIVAGQANDRVETGAYIRTLDPVDPAELS